MSEFVKKWNQPEGESLGDRIKGAVRPEGPLKPRIEQAIRQLQIQITKLDNAANRLKEKDSQLFQKIVNYLQKHDSDHATVYANELAEIRKMYKMINQAKLALEQIVTRLTTVTDLGDVVVTLAPAMAVIKSVRAGLMQIMPSAEQEISEISSLLSSILVDAGQLTGSTLNFEAANEDAERILAEASTLAEAKMKEKLPDLGSIGLPEGEKHQI
jgi:division protein CdvB (Snf7/Vps24/ESCRT-III family)